MFLVPEWSLGIWDRRMAELLMPGLLDLLCVCWGGVQGEVAIRDRQFSQGENVLKNPS